MALEYDWKIGAEIGVWFGRTFFYLLDNVDGLTLYGVDIWKPGDKFRHHADQEKNREEVTRRAEAYGGRAIILEMPSVVAAVTIPNNSLDFVFIDADHSFGAVCDDIESWTLKVKSGGFVTGHDWDWDTVRAAVQEMLPDAMPGTVENDFVWMWRKP